MRNWIYDVEFDLQMNSKNQNKKSDRLWLTSYFIIISITLVYIILYQTDKSSTAQYQHLIFFTVICVLIGAVILFSIAASIYYLKKLQVVQVEAPPRSNVQRQSFRGGLHQMGNISKLNKQNTGKINVNGKFIQKFDSNHSSEDLKAGGNQNGGVQRSSSKLGSPKANKENQRSIPSSQNSLQLQQQQITLPNQAQGGQPAQKKGSIAIQKGKTLFIDHGGAKGKEQTKAASGIFGAGIHMTDESNIVSVTGGGSNSQKKQYSIRYFLMTQLISALGWLAVIIHIGCIYCFFARAPFWNTTQIWNGVCLFALFPTHMLSILIFTNSNVNLIYDRSFFIQCIMNNYLLTIYKNSVVQIGYLSMILLIISLVWGSVMQIAKNQNDIPAIVLLSLIGFCFVTIIILRKMNFFQNQFKKGYRFLIESINR